MEQPYLLDLFRAEFRGFIHCIIINIKQLTPIFRAHFKSISNRNAGQNVADHQLNNKTKANTLDAVYTLENNLLILQSIKKI